MKTGRDQDTVIHSLYAYTQTATINTVLANHTTPCPEKYAPPPKQNAVKCTYITQSNDTYTT